MIPGQSNTRAEDVKKSGRPYLSSYVWHNEHLLKDGQVLLSFSRCKLLGVPLKEGETPAAYRQVQQGYVALYDRTGLVDTSKLLAKEIVVLQPTQYYGGQVLQHKVTGEYKAFVRPTAMKGRAVVIDIDGNTKVVDLNDWEGAENV